jgi:hypothetical protein
MVADLKFGHYMAQEQPKRLALRREAITNGMVADLKFGHYMTQEQPKRLALRRGAITSARGFGISGWILRWT